MAIRTDREPPAGENVYQAIPEAVEFRRLDAPPRGGLTLGLGRLALTFSEPEGELEGLHCHVKTGRWKTEGTQPPPQPDSRGVLAVLQDFDEEGFAYHPLELSFHWHEASRSLCIRLGYDAPLVIEVADCLLAGIDAAGRLTAVWMLDLDLSLP